MYGYILEFRTLNKDCSFTNHNYIIIVNSKTEYHSYVNKLKKSIVDENQVFVNSNIVRSDSQDVNLLKGIYNNNGNLIFQDNTDKLLHNFQQLFDT